MATMPTPRGVFTRASSGLVRQVRTDDVMFYGWQQIALSYIVFMVLFWGVYPGASMELASLLATVGGLALGACYALFAALYPRSGGEYVFLSRTAHPALGFSLSFSFAFWQLFYFGVNGGLLALFAISPILAAIGVQTGSQALIEASAWFSNGIGIFIPGALMILFHAIVQYRGAGLWFRTQRIASYVAVASLILTVVVLALAAVGVFHFQANFDALAGAGAYDKFVAQGAAAGASAAPFDLGQTWAFMAWPAFSIWFAVAATSFSGEVKNVQRSQLLGISGAIGFMGLAFIVLTFLYRSVFGADFLTAAGASFLGTEGIVFPLGAPQMVPFFTAIAGGSPILTVLMSLWVITIAWYVGGTTLIYATRAMLAWSIDGVAPDKLGEVNERYHTPHWAIVVSVIGALCWLYLFAFTTLLGPVSGFFGFALTFVAVSVWAVLFPFVRKTQFENSSIAFRVGGFPTLSLLGIIACIFVLPIFVQLLSDTALTPNPTITVQGAAIGVIIALVWFYSYRAYRKSRGVDIDERYAEIPIE